MLVNKTYKYRIYPNKDQIVLLLKHFGATRFVWNYFLDLRKISYLENKKSLNFYDNSKQLTLLKQNKNFKWLNEVNSQALQATLKDLDTAYGRFFKKQSMFPKFKAKYKHIDSFRCPQNIKTQHKKLFIPKFTEGIQIIIDREITGRMLFVTISKTSTNKFFAAITCEAEHIPLQSTTNKVGIDLGIKNLAVCSNGEKFSNPKIINKYAKQLAYEQKQLAKKQKGSGKRLKQKKKVAIVYETIKNIRKDNLHKITHSIIKQNNIIVVENLNIQGMIKNHYLAKAISDVSWCMFTKQLEYKSQWNERNFVKIDRWFPSSKTCNNCNFINQNLKLQDREWICPKCNIILDRDLNAAKNILNQGLKILSDSEIKSDIKENT